MQVSLESSSATMTDGCLSLSLSLSLARRFSLAGYFAEFGRNSRSIIQSYDRSLLEGKSLSPSFVPSAIFSGKERHFSKLLRNLR